jgi:cell fate (sporulation/competence/biofilm development) regulator YmcA (YheA/YmcA/DUF963 family)
MVNKLMKTRSIVQTLAVVAFAGSTLTACGPTKVAQCNALSSQINKASGLGKKFEEVGKEMSPQGGKVKTIEDFRRVSKEGSEKVKTLVGELDGFVTSVKAVDLKDEKLVGYRDRASTIYSGASKSLTEIANILGKFTTVEANESGKKLIESSLKDLQKAAVALETIDKDEKAVATEFNTYCGVEKK